MFNLCIQLYIAYSPTQSLYKLVHVIDCSLNLWIVGTAEVCGSQRAIVPHRKSRTDRWHRFISGRSFLHQTLVQSSAIVQWRIYINIQAWSYNKCHNPHLHMWILVSGSLSSFNNPSIHFSCGLFAGCLASIVTHPPDVVKTHLQLYPTQFSSTYQAILHILKVNCINLYKA